MNLSKYLKPKNYINVVKSYFLNFYFPQTKLKIVQTRFRNVNMLVRANEDVGKAILANNFESQELNFIQNELIDDSVFIDVGANTGLFSLYMASKSKNIKVHAFDPINLNTSLLSASIEMNDFCNVIVNKSCVGDYDGLVEFSISSDSAYSSILDSGRKAEIKKIQIPIIRLDTYIINSKIKKIDVIKIDVEGAEKLVILGASGLFYSHTLRPKLMMIELYDPNLSAFKTSIKEIIELMQLNQYKPYVLMDGALISYDHEAHANKVYNIFFRS